MLMNRVQSLSVSLDTPSWKREGVWKGVHLHSLFRKFRCKLHGVAAAGPAWTRIRVPITPHLRALALTYQFYAFLR